MADSVRRNNTSGASAKTNKGQRGGELGAITDALMEKQMEFFESRFSQLNELAKGTDSKLDAIRTELAALSGSIGLIKAEMLTIKVAVEDNSKV